MSALNNKDDGGSLLVPGYGPILFRYELPSPIATVDYARDGHAPSHVTDLRTASVGSSLDGSG